MNLETQILIKNRKRVIQQGKKVINNLISNGWSVKDAREIMSITLKQHQEEVNSGDFFKYMMALDGLLIK